MRSAFMDVVVESQITGAFEGWSGETVFELTNGQKWQQARYSYRYVYKYMPRVKILSDGSRYYLAVDGMDDTIEVRRTY
jgi:hypothetical protein